MPTEADAAVWRVGERDVRVTHLSKLYWPATGVTKGDVLWYYRAVTPTLLPHLRDRPITTRVFPEGASGPSFYRRDPPEYAPDWLRRATYHPKTAKRSTQASTLTLIDDAAGLIWLANAGSIEFHPWSAKLPNLERPDQAIFDLDPGEAASFADVCQAALLLRSQGARDGLQSYPQTSGGRGRPLYVPLAPEPPLERGRPWGKTPTERLAPARPALAVFATRRTAPARPL